MPASTFEGHRAVRCADERIARRRRARLRVDAHEGRQADPARARPALQASPGRSVSAVREDRASPRCRAVSRRRCARSKRSAQPSTQKFDAGIATEQQDLRRAHGERGIEGAAACILRRARGIESCGPQRQDAATKDLHGGGRRRRHHGRRHRDEFRERRHSRHAARSETGSAGSRHRRHPQAVRRRGGEGQAEARRRREARRADHALARLRRGGRRRTWSSRPCSKTSTSRRPSSRRSTR